MTEEQQRLLKNFETRVRQTMLLCESLQKENEALKTAIADKDKAFLQIREELRETAKKYDDLSMARSISQQDGDVNIAKQRLSKLVREINACIALVNE